MTRRSSTQKKAVINIIKQWLEGNFSLFLLIGFCAGLFLPGGEHIPKQTVIWILASVIFVSCSGITMNDIRQIHIREALLFYIARYVAFPFILFFLINSIMPEFSYAVLLLALMPPGVASSGLTLIAGGNAAIALGVTVLASFLAPFVVPGVFAVAGKSIALDLVGIGQTIGLMIFLPVFLYFFIARKINPVKTQLKSWSKAIITLLMGTMLMVITMQMRDLFLEDWFLSLKAFGVLFLLFFVFYAAVWIVYFKAQTRRRIAYTFCSGAINNGLGISLAFLYFPPEVTLFLVLSEIPWILSIPLFNRYLKKIGT